MDRTTLFTKASFAVWIYGDQWEKGRHIELIWSKGWLKKKTCRLHVKSAGKWAIKKLLHITELARCCFVPDLTQLARCYCSSSISLSDLDQESTPSHLFSTKDCVKYPYDTLGFRNKIIRIEQENRSGNRWSGSESRRLDSFIWLFWAVNFHYSLYLEWSHYPLLKIRTRPVYPADQFLFNADQTSF